MDVSIQRVLFFIDIFPIGNALFRKERIHTFPEHRIKGWRWDGNWILKHLNSPLDLLIIIVVVELCSQRALHTVSRIAQLAANKDEVSNLVLFRQPSQTPFANCRSQLTVSCSPQQHTEAA